MLKKGRIGIFDSGFGGLDIMRGIAKKLPDYDLVYLGDTARVPYGGRPQNQVYNFTKRAVDFLWKEDCFLIIFACNTVSSEALRKIQQEYMPHKQKYVKILGVLVPAAEEAAVATKNQKIGVMATEGTVLSQAFVREIKKINSTAEIFQKACPLLVSLVEEGKSESKETELILRKYLNPLLMQGVDTLILGCTHYGFLGRKIKKIVGENVQVIAESEVVAKKLADYLQRHPEIESNLMKNGQRFFYTTKMDKNFEELGSFFYGEKIKAKKIDI